MNCSTQGEVKMNIKGKYREIYQEQKIISNNSNEILSDTKETQEEEAKSLSQLRRELVEKVMDQFQGIDFETEEERRNFQTKLEYKIKSGAKLSRKEMNYLRKYNPYMYHQMVRVQQKREALKERLKHCRSKEEAQQAIGAAFFSIHEKDPVKEAMVAAVSNVSKQFCSSDTYRKLPDTIEEAERKKKKKVSAEDPFEEDKKECEDAGATYETISYSFNHKGYQEATVEAFTGSNIFVANA